MGKSSGGSSDSTVTTRFAKYIEDKHVVFLNHSEDYGDLLRDDSPYSDYTDKDFTTGLYGSGYTMASFPSLFDMYGKFMAGLDIEALFDEVLNDVQNAETILNAISAHRDVLDDDIEQTVLPRFQAGMRDMNAVMTSSFILGESIIEQGRNKKVAEFDADLRYKLIPVAAEVFTKHLAWNQGMITTYIEVMKLAMSAEIDSDKMNYEYAKLDKVWPFYVMEYERANIGALQGAQTRTESGPEGSTGASIIGGAAMGASIPGFGLPGAIIGGIAGALFG